MRKAILIVVLSLFSFGSFAIGGAQRTIYHSSKTVKVSDKTVLEKEVLKEKIALKKNKVSNLEENETSNSTTLAQKVSYAISGILAFFMNLLLSWI